ncbi:GNAT family N-acetyltransferase [Pararhodonellum marinum]|uniref:hypothetical protein n=1 Tax=Pararhodonellum marinum TaxID=2755358 RepID=UPI00188E116F|nr:hypothetical protein [Pararhodonellum marinum]
MLDLDPIPRVISSEVQEALTQTLIPNLEKSEEKVFFPVLLTIFYKRERRMLGDICFYGPPNEVGIIEIGYGTYPAYKKVP